MKKLTEQDLTSDSQSDLTKQDYTPQEKIDGVAVKESKNFSDDGGAFVEIGRSDAKGVFEEFPSFVPAQYNWSVLDAGKVKGAHLHLNQEDVWFVPPTSKLLVGLKDCREKSKTSGVVQRLVLGAGKAQLLYIPRGVAHGYKALADHTDLFYFVNQHFSTDSEKNDEYRLPPDTFGEDFWDYDPN